MKSKIYTSVQKSTNSGIFGVRFLLFALFLFVNTCNLHGKTIFIEHQTYRFDKEKNIHKYTEPRVRIDSTTISASQLDYSKDKNLMEFAGNILIKTEKTIVTAEKGVLDLKKSQHTLYNATMFDKSNNVYIKADRIEQVSVDQYVIYNGVLTRCRLDSMAWEFRGRQIVYNVDNYAYSVSTSVHFYSFPLFYSPYFSWPTTKRRTSGVLVPTYSVLNSSDESKNYGARLKIPYFVDIDRDHDVTITADIIQRRGLGVEVDYLYAFTAGMSGQLKSWYLKESMDDRDLDDEALGSKDENDDSLDLKPERHRYSYDHRQNIFLGGQLFFHQNENSDNELNKEYFDSTVELDSRFSRTLGLVFPWTSGSLSVNYETGENFIYESIYDTETDKDTHLNKKPSLTLSQRISRIADTPFSLNLSGSATQYQRGYGWNGLLKTGSVRLSSAFSIDFLNIVPEVQRDYYDYDVNYISEPGEDTSELDVNPEPYNWHIDQSTVELNFEFYRLFYNDNDVATKKLSFRPRLIYKEIADVDQSRGDTPAFISSVMSQRSLTQYLETRYYLKDPETKQVRTYLSFDLIQIYDFHSEDDQTYLSTQPTYPETADGYSLLPLRISLAVAPSDLFTASLFYRYDHEQSKVIETIIGLSSTSLSGNRFALSHTNNTTTYSELDNTYHPEAQGYTITQQLRLADLWNLSLAATWDQSRNELSTQYGEDATTSRLNRQLTELDIVLNYTHHCYTFSASYSEDIEIETISGVSTEILEKKLGLKLSIPLFSGTGVSSVADEGLSYEQGFTL